MHNKQYIVTIRLSKMIWNTAISITCVYEFNRSEWVTQPVHLSTLTTHCCCIYLLMFY